MIDHALAILEYAKDLGWPPVERLQESGKTGSSFRAITAPFLSHLIIQSNNLGGTVLEQFWVQLGNCHPKLKEKVEVLKHTSFVSHGNSVAILLQDVDLKTIDFQPILNMAAEFLTHLGVAFVNPGGRKSASGTPYSVSELVSKNTDELLQMLSNENIGARKQQLLKKLCLKRDGYSCPLSTFEFRHIDDTGVHPILAHVIPNSVHGKPDTLKCIAMFAGNSTRDLVLRNLNNVSNAMNLESNTHTAYDNLEWGIEASTHNGQVKYIYRRVPFRPQPGPMPIPLKDGDEIMFGKGEERDKLGPGPCPMLCNLHLAVSRVLKMSGAADVIINWKEEADDGDFPHIYIASEDFCDVLDAKLFLSGRAVFA